MMSSYALYQQLLRNICGSVIACG